MRGVRDRLRVAVSPAAGLSIMLANVSGEALCWGVLTAQETLGMSPHPHTLLAQITPRRLTHSPSLPATACRCRCRCCGCVCLAPAAGSQAYGSKNYRRVGVVAQRGAFVMLCLAGPVRDMGTRAVRLSSATTPLPLRVVWPSPAAPCIVYTPCMTRTYLQRDDDSVWVFALHGPCCDLEKDGN